jgi:hypothetical protein
LHSVVASLPLSLMLPSPGRSRALLMATLRPHCAPKGRVRVQCCPQAFAVVS